MTKKWTYRFLIGFVLVTVLWLFMGSSKIFNDSYSTVLYDRDHNLLGARVSADEQWRFPTIDTVPYLFEKALLTYEDKRFYSHPGIDLFAILRAIKGNIKAGKITSGASTLTMQTVRLSRKGKARSISQKLIEAALAFRLELHTSKKQLLKMYTSHAPFGGNVVGLEAASWRYFNKGPQKLSLAESAMLAVLPNAPSLIHISKNRNRLLQKRNGLLKDMLKHGHIDTLDYELALLEKIPPKPYQLPRLAPHLLSYMEQLTLEGKSRFVTTINSDIQKAVIDIVDFHQRSFAQSGIHNMGVLILDTWSGEVLAYVGNAPHTKMEHAVDMVQARRSSGSILKPFLYAYMVNEGLLTPMQLVKDVPTQIQGFKPKNYDRKYRGAMPAHKALAMSLNIPAVIMLQEYKVERLLTKLNTMGMTTLDRSADDYGLSLILGGGEVNLWELCGAYASMGRILTRFNSEMSKYGSNDLLKPTLKKRKLPTADLYRPTSLAAGAIYHTFEAMEAVRRPDQEGQWQSFSSRGKIAWKTGTSYGHRDAWSVGVTKRYTVGVWVGNADGEGVNGLIGVKKAAPVLFDIFNRLPKDEYFDKPLDDLQPTTICIQSGHKAGQYCDELDTLMLSQTVAESKTCPYHKRVFVDADGLRVQKDCSIGVLETRSWFVLPPVIEYYYKKLHPEYHSLPDFHPNCKNENENNSIAFIYPDHKSEVYLPVDLDGDRENFVAKATHADDQARLYWHLDDQFLGETTEMHTMAMEVKAGEHTLTIVDNHGVEVKRAFSVIGE